MESEGSLSYDEVEKLFNKCMLLKHDESNTSLHNEDIADFA